MQRSKGKVQGGAWEEGDREGGKLQVMYPDEDTNQYTVYIAQNYP